VFPIRILGAPLNRQSYYRFAKASIATKSSFYDPFERESNSSKERGFAAISQHLKILKEADLVSERRDGRHRIYRLQPKALQEVVNWVDEFEVFFNARLDALTEHLDRKHGRKKK
jgi:DNA-binding PadR family transcriptional regulator